MCGIFGVYIESSYQINLERLISNIGLDVEAIMRVNSLASAVTYYGLLQLQNRGQDSSGIVVFNGESFYENLGMDLVREVHTPKKLEELVGNIAIGHNRYATTDVPRPQNVQPFTVDIFERLSLAHNGNIVNEEELRDYLNRLKEDLGLVEKLELRSKTDSELLLHLIAANMYEKNCLLEDAIGPALNGSREVSSVIIPGVVGSYSLVMATKDKLIGLRDIYENRPLYFAYIGGLYMFSSERRVFHTMMYMSDYRMKHDDFINEVKGGEIITIGKTGVEKIMGEISNQNHDGSLKRCLRCSFELSYLLRGDEQDVRSFRVSCGNKLWEEEKLKQRLLNENTFVVGVTDSGLLAADGYALSSGISHVHIIGRDHYYQKRTFIEAYQKGRDIGALLKYYLIPKATEGKSVVVIDDSIVRSTTMSNIIKLTRVVGHVNEFHVRIATPPYVTPCYLGIHTPKKDELIAHGLNELQIELYFMARFYGVDYDNETLKNKVLQNLNIHQIVEESTRDGQNYLTEEEREPIDPKKFSLKYISMDGYRECFGEQKDGQCYACFIPDGRGYPLGIRRHLVGRV